MACVSTLLKAGASVTLPTVDGSLPIHVAAHENRVEIVRTFLEFGCSPDMVRQSDINRVANNNFIVSPLSETS